jgi:hypothetical protein
MIVLRIHDNNGIEDFLARTGTDPKYESLIISVLFQLFHDQFISVPPATTAINVLLCFENRILCLARTVYHKWDKFSLYVLITRFQCRWRSLELGESIKSFM